MGDFWGYVKVNLLQITKSWLWAVGIIGVTVSLFFSLQTDGLQNDVVSTYTFSVAMTGWLISFSFCAFVYATAFCEEMNHKYIRYNVIRGNLKSYVAAKAVAIYLSSLFTMFLGTFLFLLICRMQIPWTDWGSANYGVLYAGCYANILKGNHPLLYCLMLSVHLGLLAGFLSLIAALCSVYISNRILILVAPIFAWRLLAEININGYSIYDFEGAKVFDADWKTFLYLFGITVLGACLVTVGIYKSIKQKL